MNASQLQKDINSCWTVKELCRRAGVTAMTVHLWRARPNGPLPAVVIAGDVRPAIRFVPALTKQWAKQHNVALRA